MVQQFLYAYVRLDTIARAAYDWSKMSGSMSAWLRSARPKPHSRSTSDPSCRPIGSAGLLKIDYRNRTAELALAIAEPDARGKGYGTETTQLVVDYAFTALGLHNVMLTVFEFNLAGIRVYTKVGFKEFGRRRESIFMGGKLWDIILMECLSTEWGSSPVLAGVFKPDEPR